MSDKDCPVPEPFSGAIGSILFLTRIVQPNLRSLATAWVTPCAIVLGVGLFPLLLGYMGQTMTFASGIVLAGAIIIAGSGLPFLLVLIEKMDDGC